MSNTRRRVLCYIKMKEKRGEKKTYIGNVLTNFRVLDIVLKPSHFRVVVASSQINEFSRKN